MGWLFLCDSVVYGQAIPSVIGKKSVALTIKDLKKSGIVVESWIWVGFVLVPVYLFVRAAKTNKNKAPGIVWCVLFVLQFI